MIHCDSWNDHIHIQELEVLARVGVPDEERASAQRLIFNITYWPMRPTSEVKDEVAQTVDYSAVCLQTKFFVQARSDHLIETLADALASHLLETFAIQKITIELRKFILPEVEFVSVTVTRERAME
jgi:7,8-dihydroneopterin aldolase/epimerase/oxygenase